MAPDMLDHESALDLPVLDRPAAIGLITEGRGFESRPRYRGRQGATARKGAADWPTETPKATARWPSSLLSATAFSVAEALADHLERAPGARSENQVLVSAILSKLRGGPATS